MVELFKLHDYTYLSFIRVRLSMYIHDTYSDNRRSLIGEFTVERYIPMKRT